MNYQEFVFELKSYLKLDNIFEEYVNRNLKTERTTVLYGGGQEPKCYVTNQYNKAMHELLPKYGIDFVEIPRKESKGMPISASMVRKV